jgi:hypothetical protein
MDLAIMNPQQILKKLDALRRNEQEDIPRGFYRATELAEIWGISRRQTDERLKKLYDKKKIRKILLKRKSGNGMRRISYYG